MAFVPAFSSSQMIGVPTNINLADNSTGSDGAITQRQVIITTALGTNLVPAGNASPSIIPWALANSTISLNVLPNDMALSITVNWCNVGGTILYTLTQLYCYTLYSETFYYGLTQNQTSTPNIVNDTSYYNSKMILRCSIDEANNSVIFNDIVSSQNALSRALYLITNQNDFF